MSDKIIYLLHVQCKMKQKETVHYKHTIKYSLYQLYIGIASSRLRTDNLTKWKQAEIRLKISTEMAQEHVKRWIHEHPIHSMENIP